MEKEIKVGTYVTECWWTDRKVYEVIKVNSQKDVIIREMKATTSVPFSNNDWTLSSDVDGRTKNVVYRYGNWYEKYNEQGETKYYKLKLAWNVADYYYDFEF